MRKRGWKRNSGGFGGVEGNIRLDRWVDGEEEWDGKDKDKLSRRMDT